MEKEYVGLAEVPSKTRRPGKKLKDFVKPVPREQESDFRLEELFISITDKKSHIEFGNEIFTRISKYENHELSGQLHSIIRHPDMPRAAFKIFWDYLKSDKMAVAYVKNLAKDGTYYWVLAVVISHGSTYQSIRLKPGSELFEKVKVIYNKTLEFEKKEEKVSGKAAALARSEDYMLELLNEAGFKDYDEFLLEALKSEIYNRIDKLNSKGVNLKRYVCKAAPPELIDIARHLKSLCIQQRVLNRIQKALYEHSDYILDLAHSILLLSLNAQIGSTKLDKSDISLSVVAEKMGEQSLVGEKQLLEMKESINELHKIGTNLNMHILLTTIQTEQTLVCYQESEQFPEQSNDFMYSYSEMIEQVLDAYKPRLQNIINDIARLPEVIKKIVTGIEELEKFLMVLRFIHITGKVEIARMSDNSNSFSTTFAELIEEVENAEMHVKELSKVSSENKDIVNVYSDLSDKLTYLNSVLFK
ncbi:MAG TPA: hypothetical protein DEQ34_02640 [Balneolaceae bacterium]|nr:hypothetical protein [Balneolaceae bacterium]|tara:strand:- start:190065 stop:191483 length:1419 start_codon:yes stop_codon:yes gene_type:complete